MSLIFAILIIICLGVDLIELTLLETLCASGTWMSVSFPKLGNFLAIISSNKLSTFSIFFFFWDLYNASVNMQELFQEVCWASLI